MPSCDAPGWRQSRRWRRRCRSRRVRGRPGSTSSWAARPPRSRSPRPLRRATRTWRPTGSRTSTSTPTSPTPTAAPARWAPAASRRRRRSYTAECASITFDARGRLVTVCVGLDRPTLRLLDPVTLDTIASYPLPPRTPGARRPADELRRRRLLLPRRPGPRGRADDRAPHRDRRRARRRASCPTATSTPTSRSPPTDQIISRPARLRRAHLVRDEGGRGGHRRPGDGRGPRARRWASRSATRSRRGRRRRLRRHRRRACTSSPSVPTGAPQIVWRSGYDNDGTQKSGQTENGSGTTPTLTTSGYVAITDNADPIKVVVYRRSDGARLVCTEPVFDQGAFATDQSLIAARTRSSPRTTSATRARPRPRTGARPSPGSSASTSAAGTAARRRWRSDEIAPVGRAQARRSPTACSTPTPSPRATTARTRGTSPRSTRAPAGPSTSASAARAWASTTTTRRSRSGPTARRTSGR